MRPNVTSIFLDKNEITDKGAIIIGSSLVDLKKLSYLDLQNNNIDKPGATALTTLKLANPALAISLNGNFITNVVEMEKITDVTRPVKPFR